MLYLSMLEHQVLAIFSPQLWQSPSSIKFLTQEWAGTSPLLWLAIDIMLSFHELRTWPGYLQSSRTAQLANA